MRWYHNLGWAVIVLLFGVWAIFWHPRQSSVEVAQQPVSKVETPAQVVHDKEIVKKIEVAKPAPVVKSVYPYEVAIVPHAHTYYIKNGKVVKDYKEGKYPLRYISGTALSEQTADGKKFIIVRIADGQAFNQDIYMFSADDLIRL